eukprot:CAMPEP_0205912694 /NCGR_PEP_ID=MMETSP1325-20131115/6024_1 /ASSEMBLY_ACC=CAM_ASM_000708 /TAXON_ID=236786 /ORGANISM="Florenciella sp., Strain RCC1007" /LENGTH=143 /DNA_ID=CAMNT_0053279445 /DNA_START=126 /DNA_END=557 /DNA_ORIENTATION=-
MSCKAFLLKGLLLVGLLSLQGQAINVIEVDSDSYKSITDGSKNVLLKFYTPDCHMCDVIDPEFEYAASKYDEGDEMLFGRVNGYRERDIVDELGVTGYPVFKWWKKGESEPEPFYYVHYSGRHGHTLMRMVNDRLGREHHDEL